MTNLLQSIIALAVLLMTVGANAALISRAGGAAYYDDVLGITWLADANYAQTSGYDSDGQMNWDLSQTWVGTLNTANHLGANDWRLPTVTDTGTLGCNYSTSGGTDCGYNADTNTGEMASLFYDTLGNLGFYDTAGNPTQPGWGLTNTGPFSHLQSGTYWYGTEYAPNTTDAWHFAFGWGDQNVTVGKNNAHFAWAVRSGDIGTVPVPATIWLFGSALGLLGWKRQQTT